MLERLRRWGVRRHHRHRKTSLPQLAQDVVLDAEIVGNNRDVRRWHGVALAAAVELARPLGQPKCRAQLVVFVPRKRRLVRDLLHVIHADQAVPLLRLGQGALGGGVALRGEVAVHRATDAELFGQRPGVDALNAGDAVAFHVVAQRTVRAVIAHDRRQLTDDKPAGVRLVRLHVLLVDAVVADERIGHGDDLPLVRRVGQDFLIPRHRSVETNLPGDRRRSAERLPLENGAVLQCEDGFRPQARHRRGG